MSLNDQLEGMRQASWGRWPKEKLEVVLRARDELVRSGIVDRILQIGDQAPDFSLPSSLGGTVRLSEVLRRGPLVLAFYRGHWWRYCNAELSALQQLLADIRSLGAELVAVSPELPGNSLVTVEKNNLTFPILNDLGNQVAKMFGLVFQIPPDLHEVYLSLGIDLPAHNGDQSYELPLPATYVIDRDGTIRAVFADADYVKRMEPADILAVLRALR